MKVLTRADFLTATPLRRELVDVPELGGSVYLRELTAGELLDYNIRLQRLQAVNPDITPSASLELMALLIAYSAQDESGASLFTEADVKALSARNLPALLRLSLEVLRVSGIASGAAAEVAVNLKKAGAISSTN